MTVIIFQRPFLAVDGPFLLEYCESPNPLFLFTILFFSLIRLEIVFAFSILNCSMDKFLARFACYFSFFSFKNV